MQNISIKMIGGGPVKHEYKAPFVPSALVFKGIVGFCFQDFCRRVYDYYRYTDEVQLLPEFFFAKMIALWKTKSQANNARKMAIELLMFMDYPYRPWYIDIFADEFEKQFLDLDIDLFFGGFVPCKQAVVEPIDHPYMAIALGMFQTATLDFDFVKFAKLLGTVMSSRAAYQYAKENGYFEHDKVLLTLYEFIHMPLRDMQDKFPLRSLNMLINGLVELKSQSLLMFDHYFSHDYKQSVSYAREFVNAPNFAKNYTYQNTLYKNALNQAIGNSDWEVFEEFLQHLAEKLGPEHVDVVNYSKEAAAKRALIEAPAAPSQPPKQTGTKQAKPKQPEKPKAKENLQPPPPRKEHDFSPFYATPIALEAVSTQNLFGLITILDAIGDNRGRVLIKDRLKYIFPSMDAVYRMLYSVISSKIIKLDQEFFDQIPDSKINNWESYFGAPFEVNILGYSGPADILSTMFREELQEREDRREVCLNYWRSLATSYFYSSFEYYSSTVQDTWIDTFELNDEIKELVAQSELSCRKLSYVAYSAIKNTVSFHHMGESGGPAHTRNILTHKLKKFIELAINSEVDHSKPRMDKAPVFKAEELLGELAVLTPDQIYDSAPTLDWID